MRRVAVVIVTILGGSGFIGGHLARHLKAEGHDVRIPDRADIAKLDGDLGHVVYAIGLTGDFRRRPHDTVEAHVTTLSQILQQVRFKSFLYLSSTRVYGGLGPGGIAQEDAALPIHPSADSLYDLSKLLGEALCLGMTNPSVRVARLSNVYGPGQDRATFMGSILDELARSGQVEIKEDPLSSKDYISVTDAAALLGRVALAGRQRLYNIASGTPTSHAQVADALATLIGGRIRFAEGAPRRVFPRIDISRIREEFGARPASILTDLPELLSAARPPETNKRA